VYLAAYPILNLVFGTGLLNLGIYLPMLVVEPLLTYRFGRVQETVHKAVSKGVRITVGYTLLLLGDRHGARVAQPWHRVRCPGGALGAAAAG